VTALDWLNQHAGERVAAVIWEPLLRGKFDSFYGDVTMAWLWGRVRQRAESRDSWLGGELLGYIDGGFQRVITRLVEEIHHHGGEIRTRTPVHQISHDEATDQALLLTDHGTLRADRALATVPSGIVADLIQDHIPPNPGFATSLRSVQYLDAVVRVFASKQRITKFYWHNINTPNAPFVVFLSLTELVGCARFDGLHVYYIGAYVGHDHEYMTSDRAAVIQQWNDGLKAIFPAFDTTLIVDDHLFRLRNAQHIVDVGFEKTKLPPHQTPCPSLLMCNFTQIFPMDRGTNYAVRDGNRMAEHMLTTLGDLDAAHQTPDLYTSTGRAPTTD
jgi:protoporphyrinogen oxidase